MDVHFRSKLIILYRKEESSIILEEEKVYKEVMITSNSGNEAPTV